MKNCYILVFFPVVAGGLALIFAGAGLAGAAPLIAGSVLGLGGLGKHK